MSSDSVCRLCLANDAPVLVISDSPLQEVYEKLTYVSLNTQHKPVVACSLCYWQLRKCHNLMTRSMRADQLLTNILQTGALINRESISMIDRRTYKLENSLNISPMELNDFLKPEPNIKEEIKDESLSYTNDEEIEGEQMINAKNIKIENCKVFENIEAHLLEDFSDVMNEELAYEDDIVQEEKDGPGDIFDEIDIEEIKLEPIEQTNKQRKDAGPDMKCKLHPTRNTGPQDTTALQNNTRSPEIIVVEETDSSDIDTPVQRNTMEDIIKQIKNTSRYCMVVLNKSNPMVTKHKSENYICEVCGDVLSTKYLLLQHMELHNAVTKDNGYRSGLRKKKLKQKGSVSETYTKDYECNICHRKFIKKVNLEFHLVSHFMENPFKCATCGTGFQTRGQLEIHFRTHSEKKLFECSICQKTFTRKYDLKSHVRTHSNERPYKCAICGKRFTQQNNLYIHKKIHFENKPYKCTICEKKFDWQSGLKVHLRTHTGEKPFECATCSKRFYTRAALNSHSKSHSEEKPFECATCQKGFQLRSSLIAHLRTHSEEKAFECTICPRKYKQKIYLSKHMKTHATEEQPFKCTICGKIFSDRYQCDLHCRLHSGEKPFECGICKKKFTQQGGLKVHSKIHSGEKPFKCEICHRRFRVRSNLNAHLTTHSEEKSFECATCERRFRTKLQLKEHLKTHTGERPYKCIICQKRFRQCGGYSAHLKTHSTEKPFECTICDLRFNQKVYLSRHLKRQHSKGNLYECAECGKKVTTRWSLIVHWRIHSGEKPYKCTICRKRFVQRGTLNKHKHRCANGS